MKTLLLINSRKIPAEIVILLGAAILFIPFLGLAELFDWDEINFAESSREMIVTGNYSIPQINFIPYWEKPPLFFWLQVISMKAFGVNEFAARFPNAVCGMVTLVMLFRIARKNINEQFGWIWVLVYACSLLPQLYFKSGIIDPWFNLFIFLAIYHLSRYCRSDKLYCIQSIIFAGLFTGLAVLTKGPVALLIVGLCYGVYAIINRFKNFMRFTHILLFLVATSSVGGIWFIALWMQGQQHIISEFIVYQIRLFQTEDAGHGGSFFYHFIVLLVGCFPLAALGLLSMRVSKSEGVAQPQFHRWMLILFWVVLLLFSVVKTKIVHYSSLCYFPLSFLAALAFYQLYNHKKQLPAWNKYLQIITGVLLSLLILGLSFIDRLKPWLLQPGRIQDEFAKGNLQANVSWTGFEIIPGLIMLGGVIYFALHAKRKTPKSLIVLFITAGIGVNLLLVMVAPKIAGYSQGAAVEFYESKQHENAIIETVEFFSYAHLFYAKRPPHLGKPAADSILAMQTQPTVPVYFVTKIQYAEDLEKERLFLKRLYAKNGFVFYKSVKPLNR